MKNSADLGGYYPPRPSASVYNTLHDLQNSSYPTQPHSIIANYIIPFLPSQGLIWPRGPEAQRAKPEEAP